MKNRNSDKQSYEEQIIDEASLKNQMYSYNKIQPSTFFWKQLTYSPSKAPMILVPDTLILNDKDTQIMWVYTNLKTQTLCKETNIGYKDFISKITNYTSPNQLVALLKRPIFQQNLFYVHQYKLLNCRYLQNSTLQQIVTQKNQVICLQRFIKSSGSKAFLCRTIYEQNKAARCYLLTNKNTVFYNNQNCSSGNSSKEEQSQNKKFVVKASCNKSTLCIKSKQGNNLEETLKSLKEIVKYMQFIRGIKITEIIGDFIKDEANNWWLINIKAFRIQQKIQKTLAPPMNKIVDEQSAQQLQKERYQKTKTCRYCEKNYLEPELTHKMTMRMIIQVDKYLVHMGKWDKWLKRSDTTNVDAHCLYQQHKVCERCYRLYSEIQQLMQVEAKFLKKLGSQLESSPKDLIISQSNQAHLWNQSKNKQINRLSEGIPEIIQLGPNTNITTIDNYPICNDEIINKMMRFRFLIFLNEIDEVVELGENLSYYLEISIFQKKARYRLDTSLLPSNHNKYLKAYVSNEPQNTIPLKKLKVLYFFANSIEQLQQYAKNDASLQINMIVQSKKCLSSSFAQSAQGASPTQISSMFRLQEAEKVEVERKLVGSLSLPLKDFVSSSSINTKKDFYKFLNVQGVPYGWGLQGSVGIIASDGYVNTSRLVFQKTDKQIYLPNQNYYFCEHLPQEWIGHIKTKHEQSRKFYSSLNPITLSQKWNCDLNSRKQNSSMVRFQERSRTRKVSLLHQKSYRTSDQKSGMSKLKQCRVSSRQDINRFQDDQPPSTKTVESESWSNILKNQIQWYENCQKNKTKKGEKAQKSNKILHNKQQTFKRLEKNSKRVIKFSQTKESQIKKSSEKLFTKNVRY